jgi:hypothetical protein
MSQVNETSQTMTALRQPVNQPAAIHYSKISRRMQEKRGNVLAD